MPPGPRKASLILLSLYAHLSDWPANKQVGIYRLNASSGCWVMGPGTHGSSPPCLALGAPACILLLYVVEAQIEIRHAARYPEVGLVFIRRSYLYNGGALRENRATCRPLCPLNYIVRAPACPGPVIISTIRPMTPRAQEMYTQLRQPPVGQDSIR